MNIFTDGGSRGNPGKSASSFVVYEGNVETYSEAKFLGVNTNNFAEYTGVLIALRWMSQEGHNKAVFFSDSELMVKQLNGQYKIKNETLLTLNMEIKEIIAKNNLIVTFTHVLRTKNVRADELVNQKLDNYAS